MYNILKISADILIQLIGDTILNVHSFSTNFHITFAYPNIFVYSSLGINGWNYQSHSKSGIKRIGIYKSNDFMQS